MIKLKRKNLDRREWYTDAQWKFSCMYHRDGSFAGAVGLLTFGQRIPVAGVGAGKRPLGADRNVPR